MSYHPNPAPLVLASASPYRRELLARLRLPFVWQSPEIDESPAPGEQPAALVVRLAEHKARAVATRHPASIIIGSDQVAVLTNDEILTKPGILANARKQLAKLSGREVVFHTGLCVFNAASDSIQTGCIPVAVKFRKLEPGEIDNYLDQEQPFDCAGSFKSEGLGISLLESISGSDPTALIGLPLIRLSEMLRLEGINLP